eukprot:7108045-Prymnesium_polylepis.1
MPFIPIQPYLPERHAGLQSVTLAARHRAVQVILTPRSSSRVRSRSAMTSTSTGRVSTPVRIAAMLCAAKSSRS